jgi:hypothetical protein
MEGDKMLKNLGFGFLALFILGLLMFGVCSVFALLALWLIDYFGLEIAIDIVLSLGAVSLIGLVVLIIKTIIDLKMNNCAPQSPCFSYGVKERTH